MPSHHSNISEPRHWSFDREAYRASLVRAALHVGLIAAVLAAVPLLIAGLWFAAAVSRAVALGGVA